MSRKRNVRKYMHYFLIDVGAKRPIRLGVKARNATQQVILSRTLMDVMKGKQKGLAITCANALCALRQNGDSIPHDVFMAEFTDNRAYLVDRLDQRGVPVSCVVYAHDQGSFQKEFDKTSKNALAKMSGVERMFVLTPPPVITSTPNKPGEGRKQPTRGGSGTTGGERHRRKAVFHKGAVARAVRQGVELTPEKKKKTA